MNILEKIENEKVEWKRISDIREIKVISPKRKLKKQEYLDEGVYPVIDQGQSFIVGYTNDSSAVFNKNSYVVFGDHTESVKYVDFQFAQGADGIKVLQTDEKYLNSRYLYHAILNFYEITGKYMRHFSLLKKTEIPIPSLETQEEIVEILDKFTSYVAELEAELEARTKQYEYYRDMLLSEDYLNKLYNEMCGDENKKKVVKLKLSNITYYSTEKIKAEFLNSKNYVGVENLLKDKRGKVNSNHVPTTGNLLYFKKRKCFDREYKTVFKEDMVS